MHFNAKHKKIACVSGSIIASLLAINIASSQFNLHVLGVVPSTTGSYQKNTDDTGNTNKDKKLVPAILSVTMASVEKTTTMNRPIMHKVIIKKAGVSNATGVTATMTVSPGILFDLTRTSPNCTQLGKNTLSCKVGDLSMGQQRTMVFGNTADRSFGCNQQAKFALVAQATSPLPNRDSFIDSWSTTRVVSKSHSSVAQPAVAVNTVSVSCGSRQIIQQ